MNRQPILEVRGLTKHFPIRTGVFSRVSGQVRAVEGVSLSILPGQTYGLVGESGCGKSTLGQAILRLVEPTAGEVFYQGRDVLRLGGGELRQMRRQMQIIFQDPYSALNPRLTVGSAIGEMLAVHGVARGAEVRRRVEQVLERCGLASYCADRYPHEFSGGQRQRVVIARALVLEPKLVIADEPVSALDVSIQSQILNLLESLQEDLALTFLFISHDLGVVKHMADRVGVMYLGHLVEEAEKREFYRRPLHPYSQALLSAIPRSDPTVHTKRIILKGDVPSPANPPSGCPFHTRCPYAMRVCRERKPPLVESATGHRVACHLVNPPAAEPAAFQPLGNAYTVQEKSS